MSNEIVTNNVDGGSNNKNKNNKNNNESSSSSSSTISSSGKNKEEKTWQEGNEELMELRRVELQMLRETGKEIRLQHRREILSLSQQKSHMEATLQGLLQQLQKSSSSLYQHSIKQVSAENLPPPYVIKIQAQLCHALHFHEIVLKQIFVLQNKHAKPLAEYLKQQTAQLTNQNATRELALLNQMATIEQEQRMIKKDKEFHLEQIKKEIMALHKQLGIEPPPSDGLDNNSFSGSLRQIWNNKVSPIISPKSAKNKKLHLDQRSNHSHQSSHNKQQRVPPPPLDNNNKKQQQQQQQQQNHRSLFTSSLHLRNSVRHLMGIEALDNNVEVPQTSWRGRKPNPPPPQKVQEENEQQQEDEDPIFFDDEVNYIL